MLKTLRVTSFVAVFLAFCGVAAMFFMGLKGDPEVKAFLESPGVIERFKGKAKNPDKNESKTHPLVAQAQAFALRIDPPPPPKPPEPKVKKPPKSDPIKQDIPKIPGPKVPQSVKSNLLATVLYKSSPERSLALLETTGGKQEWFRQGETVGHLEIQEIRDGSVVFTQGGKNPQEKFVPVKPTKSILKSEQTTPAAMSADLGSIAVQLPTFGGEQQTQTNTTSAQTTSSGSTQPARPIDRKSRPRADVSKRIQRIRSVPTQPSPQDQKKLLEETVSGMEAIMSSQINSDSPEQNEKDKEMWRNMMEILKAEKAKIDPSPEDTEEKPDDTKKSEDAKKTAASKPEKPE